MNNRDQLAEVKKCKLYKYYLFIAKLKIRLTILIYRLTGKEMFL